MTSPVSEWLESTAEARAGLLAYSLSAIPTDPGQRQLDVSDALTHGQNAGDMLADVEQFLIMADAEAVLRILKEQPDLSSSERKVVVKAETAEVRRLRDGIKVMYQTIKDRRFALMNLNRSA